MIGSHETTVSTEQGITRVTYHQTAVVKYGNGNITLNSGGWMTPTTKKRMNQTSETFGLGFKVFQKAGAWFVDYKGNTLDFADNMQLNDK